MQGLFSTSLKMHELTQKSVVRVYFHYMHTALTFKETEETLNTSNTDRKINMESQAKKNPPQNC